MRLGSDHFVGKNLPVFFQRLLLPLPVSGDVIYVSGLHARLHLYETDGLYRLLSSVIFVPAAWQERTTQEGGGWPNPGCRE